ncbi:adenosylcobinamide-GDP ribazoletransferase [Vibrio sp. YMD68]|uniref:adenosylcobinamide-GDP ribazoletransferase n=1 Tax=Vibrio sp. YMD68 TaxID=3042300 RepID=UPI002499F574|nr:adenosylcobinamide-GDP ribazoletransferase [Vibrio sp. YMD68]WGV99075.1 adenosylcobinamide-GDP ribazoletransferase [Vibrio sp. YMD68]
MVAWFRYQRDLFWLALSFFSRIPIPKATPYSAERMNRSGRYFALVGALLGAICGGSFWLLSLILPNDIALFVMLAFSLMLTGAFHEDGLTDMADGIGGGMSIERRLSIMKDSRIGTYGAATLVMGLLGKFLLLSELAERDANGGLLVFLVVIMAYTVSRTVAASLIFDMPYVSDNDTSKSKPLAQTQTPAELAFLMACAALTLLILTPLVFCVLALTLLIARYAFKRWLFARIGGFTGDCLGAAQQLSELLIYLILVGFAHNQVNVLGGWL